MKTPRIGYLLKKFPRLSETFVLNEILGLEDLGEDLCIFSRRPPDDEPRHPQIERLKAAVEVLPQRSQLDPWSELFPSAADGVPILATPEDWASLAEIVGVLREVDYGRTSRVLGEALWLVRRCRELGVEHLHVHFATESAVVAMVVRAFGGPTYSLTAHAKDIYRSTVDPGLLSRVIERSAFTVTVCDANVAHVQSLVTDAAAEHVRKLYNGIDLERFDYSPKGRDEHHVLGVGRLVEKKGFDVFVDACAELERRGIPFRATLAGDGDQAETLRAQIRSRGLQERVTLTGPLDQDQVRALMQEATLFCLPCIVGDDGNRDALPTVLLESLAVGLPCVSTPVTGIPEILGNGAAGMIVPERDVIATADAIARLLSDPDERLRLAAVGRARAEELFDSRRISRTLHSWHRAARQSAGLEIRS